MQISYCLVIGVWGFGVFLFFKQIGVMPCAWFYKVAEHCRLLANTLAWANAFVCYTSQSLSFLPFSVFLHSFNVLIVYFKSNLAFKYQQILLTFLEVMLIWFIHAFWRTWFLLKSFKILGNNNCMTLSFTRWHSMWKNSCEKWSE